MLDDAARRRRTQLVMIAVISAALVALVYIVAVRTRTGQRLDDIAFDRRSVVTAATTRRTDRLLGTVSVASLFTVGAALVAVAIARGRVALAVAVGVAMSGAVLTTEVLKLGVLTRPDLTGVGGVPGNSYPSGHATIGMVLSLGVVMVAPLHLRRVALLVAALVSTAFGTAVLSSGWHRPSDTIGAYLVALAWFAAASAVLVDEDTGLDPPPSKPMLAVAAAGVLGLSTYVLWRSVSSAGLRTVVYAAPYIAACIAIDVAGLLIVGLYYVVVRTVTERRSGATGAAPSGSPARR